MSRVETRKIAEDDGGQTTGGRPVRRLQRGGGAEGSQEPFRTSQGVRRKGTNFDPLTALALANYCEILGARTVKGSVREKFEFRGGISFNQRRSKFVVEERGGGIEMFGFSCNK